MFGVDDFDTLRNARWPFFVAINCLNAFFDAPNEESLGEVALEASDRGAIAFLGSTTVLPLAGQRALLSALAKQGLRSPVRTVGDTVRRAMSEIAGSAGAEDVLRSFVLLGDPATRLPIFSQTRLALDPGL